MAVIINGRTAVHKGSNGTLVTQDDCYTGPNNQVVTYQNIAKSEDAENCAKTVFINGNPICHKNSYFSKSTGDEAGNGGGVKSGTIQGKAEFVTASPNVFIEGIPAVRAGDLMVSNNRNTPPAALQQASPPFGGNQDKINKFPLCDNLKIDYDLSGMPVLYIPNPMYIGSSFAISLSGVITVAKEGQCNLLTLNKESYEAEAKGKVSDFLSYLTMVSYDEKHMCIGSQITGDYWSTSVKYDAIKDVWEYEAAPQSVSKKFEYWDFEGQLGFKVTTKSNKKFPDTGIINKEMFNKALEDIGLGPKVAEIFAEVAFDLVRGIR